MSLEKESRILYFEDYLLILLYRSYSVQYNIIAFALPEGVGVATVIDQT